MKTHRIISLATVLLTGLAILGCQAEKPIGEARAVAAGEEVLSFEAVKAEAQTLPIYADGDWAVDVDSDWISVEPMRGRGMGSVTVSVSDNLKGGVQNVPRQGKIIIQGGNTDVAIITETQAAQDISGGKVKGICNSVANRDLYTKDLEPLKPVPIIPEIAGVKAEDVDGLVCAWPMTIYVPASVPDELAQWLNDFCATIRDSEDYMKQIKGLGSTNTFQVFSLKQINDIQQDADAQIQEVFKAFEGWTPKK